MAESVNQLTFVAPSSPGGPVRVEGVRNARYGEVLLVRAEGDRLTAEVWNTLGLNDCPDDAWQALDDGQITADAGALLAILNGPRYWLMDAIENAATEERKLARFGELDMFRAAVVDLGTDLPDRRPYKELRVLRSTVFEWAAGREVHELVDADGGVYVMQSYSLEVDPSLTEAALGRVAPRITLPEGWSARSRTLAEPLRVECPDEVAIIVQDDLKNTYQRSYASA
jgi:hypothetical protein